MRHNYLTGVTHTLAGDFANSWKFADGKAVKTVKQKTGGGIGIELKSVSEYCTSYYSCTDTYHCVITFAYTEVDGNLYGSNNETECNENYSD